MAERNKLKIIGKYDELFSEGRHEKKEMKGENKPQKKKKERKILEWNTPIEK